MSESNPSQASTTGSGHPIVTKCRGPLKRKIANRSNEPVPIKVAGTRIKLDINVALSRCC
jgi:hypothetical protein